MKTRISALISLSFFVFCVGSSAVYAKTSPHQAYEKILKSVVTDTGVDWAKLKKNEQGNLNQYLSEISAYDTSTLKTTQDQLAFWINAHNACVMKLLLDRVPIQDVMRIDGFRDKLKCKVAGTEYTLLDMESRVIRPLFQEPRVHFALWWGVRGGPRLAPHAYNGSKLDTQLDQQTKAALGTSSFVRLPEKTGNISLSPLFDWFRSDFGETDQKLLSFIRKHASKETSDSLKNRKKQKVEFLTFDWTLDGARD